MGDGESEIGRGKRRPIQRRAARGSQKAKPKRRGFTEARRQRFLNHFAASCNAAAAARAVGVSENCVYEWRKKDAQLRDAFYEALDQGAAALEAEQIRAAREAVKIRRSKSAAVRVGTMDAKTSLAVLEAYRRSRGRDPGKVWPHPYDAEAVLRRLEEKMRLLGLMKDKEAGGSNADPAPRSPSPGEPGEDE